MPRARRSLRRSLGNRRSRNRSRKGSRRPSGKRRTYRSRRYRAQDAQVWDVVDGEMHVCSDDLSLSLGDITETWDFLLDDCSPKTEGTLSGAYSMDDIHQSLIGIMNLVHQGGDPFLLLCEAALKHRKLQEQPQYRNMFDCGVAAREYIRICTRFVSLTTFHRCVVDRITALKTLITSDDQSELVCYCRYLRPPIRSLVHAFVIHTNPESVTHGFGKRLRIVFSMQNEYDVACSGLGHYDGQFTSASLKDNWTKIGLPYTQEQTWSKDNDRSQVLHFLNNIYDCTFSAVKRTLTDETFEANIFVLRTLDDGVPKCPGASSG